MVFVSAAQAAGSTIPAPLAALVQGVVNSMFWTPWKIATVVLLTLGVAGSGMGLLTHYSLAGPQGDQQGNPPAGIIKVTQGAKVPDKLLPIPPDKPRPEKLPTDKVPDKASPPPPGKPEPVKPPVQGISPGDWPTLEALPTTPNKRLLAWRDRLTKPFNFPGFDDPKMTLQEALDLLAEHFGVHFEVNDEFFAMENVMEVESTPICDGKPFPKISTSLATVLRIILRRVSEKKGSEAGFILRPDHVEITTSKALRTELGIPQKRPLLPLIWDAFNDTPINEALERLEELSGFNVMIDPRVKEKVEEMKTSARLNNVPADTAISLLANMAGLETVRKDNVFYITSRENALQLQKDRARLNGDKIPEKVKKPTKKPAPPDFPK